MEYYFNHLDPVSFQRLINGILVARFGEDVRLTPLRGSDGGRDGETAPDNPFCNYEVNVDEQSAVKGTPVRLGRYLFQVKHHRTIDTRLSDARRAVISDFEAEIKSNVLSRTGSDQVNYFILITNVPSSEDALGKLDGKRKELLSGVKNLHADIWWEERLFAHLDQLPSLWNAFPSMFAGGRVPLLAQVVDQPTSTLPRAL